MACRARSAGGQPSATPLLSRVATEQCPSALVRCDAPAGPPSTVRRPQRQRPASCMEVEESIAGSDVATSSSLRGAPSAELMQHVLNSMRLTGSACVLSRSHGCADGMVTAWQALSVSPFPLREGQVEMLCALATGVDVLSRQPTGSGKSAWIEAHTKALSSGSSWGAVLHGRLPPCTVVVVPWRSLGFDQEREADGYLEWLYDERRVAAGTL